MKPKECCNCPNVFYVADHKFFQRDLCDACVEIVELKEENYDNNRSR